VVRDQMELAKAAGVTILTRGAENVPPFPFDRDLLRVALSNLLQNAVQASAAGGAVELRASNGNENVTVSVRDSGEGIAPEHLEGIFNPFFTTKPRGVGLGLALVAKIVDEHGGRIRVSSEKGKGTRFEIDLPRH
jgi:signal transduction histidine kinase